MSAKAEGWKEKPNTLIHRLAFASLIVVPVKIAISSSPIAKRSPNLEAGRKKR